MQVQQGYSPEDVANRQLYVAQFSTDGDEPTEENHALLSTTEGEPEQTISITGEVLAEGTPGEKGNFIVQKIHRIALSSEPLEELGGLMSIAGPMHDIYEEGEAASDRVAMRLYYSILGNLEPACDEFDATYPQKELIVGDLEWWPPQTEDENEDDERLRLNIRLHLYEYEVSVEEGGNVDSFTLHVPLSFRPLRPFQPGNEESELARAMRYRPHTRDHSSSL